MTNISNISTLITILFGLMLTDLYASVHRLIRHRKRISWHWLPLLVSWYVLTMILKNWWSLVLHEGDGSWGGGWIFFYYGHLLLLLYLLVAAVLPDEIPIEGLDLRKFYLDNRRHFWGLLAVVHLTLVIFAVLQPVFTESPLNWLAVLANIVMGAIALSLAWSRSIRYHAVVVIILVVFTLIEIIEKF
ncbi:hypothetical protein KAR48_11070 [bacterium]|nr:hypothetical protein [bacterium]